MFPRKSYLLGQLTEHQWVSDDQAASIHARIPSSIVDELREQWVFEEVIERGLVTVADLLQLISETEGVVCLDEPPALDLSTLVQSLCVIDVERSLFLGVVPICENEKGVVLLSAYPFRYELLEDLSHQFASSVDVCITTPSIYEQTRSLVYGVTDNRTQTVAEASSVYFEGNFKLPKFQSDGSEAGDSSIEEYVLSILESSIIRRASDIHIEPSGGHLNIRCRIDGVLSVVAEPENHIRNAVVSKIKLMAHLDIAEKRLPQDGRFHLNIKNCDYDFRVSTIPSIEGESVVIRILDQKQLNIGLSQLGMSRSLLKAFEKRISAPDGLFLVTGPTGSGKSTTLYSALNHINDPHVKIITVEDPVEYHLDGINQVRVRNELNMTFASALKAILRQAPNIIMIGEIRDRETTEIVINASLTGHSVFSTLHTNDAGSAVTRLIDMGAKPFLVAAALKAVLAQRLVRTIPLNERIPYAIADWEAEALGLQYGVVSGQQFYRAGKNRNTYYGRMGIFEMFEIDEGLSEIIYQNHSLTRIHEYLREHEFRNMRQDAIEKAKKGFTSIEEVLATTVI